MQQAAKRQMRGCKLIRCALCTAGSDRRRHSLAAPRRLAHTAVASHSLAGLHHSAIVPMHAADLHGHVLSTPSGCVGLYKIPGEQLRRTVASTAGSPCPSCNL